MASKQNHGVFQPIERLVGRENYRSWATAMKAYLQIEELWGTIETPEGGTAITDTAKLTKAKAKIILAVERDVYVHVENADSPKTTWQNLKNTYDDQGLTRKVHLLQDVATTRLENCKSTEDYISRIMSASQKLSSIGTTLPYDLVGALLLPGLPSEYKPMIMALGSSGKDITADLVKTKLLEESESGNSYSNFEARGLYAQTHPNFARAESNSNNRWRDRQSHKDSSAKTKHQHNTNKRKVRCFNCNQIGHFSSQCNAPKRKSTKVCTAEVEADDSKPEEIVCALISLTSKAVDSEKADNEPHSRGKQYRVSNSATVSSALLTLDSSKHLLKNEWIIDSGASKHMCCDSSIMVNVKKPLIKSVTAANQAKVPVEADGNILLHNTAKEGVAKILLQDVLHVPAISTNLMSVSAATKNGCQVTFLSNKCEI